MAPHTLMPPAPTVMDRSEPLAFAYDGYGTLGYESAQPMFMQMNMAFGLDSTEQAGRLSATGKPP